jgi:hypothetical protein
MQYQFAHNTNDHLRVLPGALVYGAVCASGIGSAWVLGFFAITSFFAFIYLMLNSGPRSWGALLLSLIPVIGALIALERMAKKAGKLILGGIFFYIFPVLFMTAPISGRIFGFFLGTLLFWAFFGFVPGVRARPGMAFVFMWALPTIFFFIILAIVMPFIGRAADVDAGDFDGYADDYDHGYDHASSDSATNIEFSSDFGGGVFTSDYEAGNYGQFELASYPEQAIAPIPSQTMPQPAWFESSFDPTSGRLTIEGSNGNFDLSMPSPGELMGFNSDGQMVHFSHNPDTNTVMMTGPDGIKFMLQDEGTGTWAYNDASGRTTISNDPVTGWTHVRGPDTDMTIKYNPFNNTATGTESV